MLGETEPQPTFTSSAKRAARGQDQAGCFHQLLEKLQAIGGLRRSKEIVEAIVSPRNVGVGQHAQFVVDEITKRAIAIEVVDQVQCTGRAGT